MPPSSLAVLSALAATPRAGSAADASEDGAALVRLVLRCAALHMAVHAGLARGATFAAAAASVDRRRGLLLGDDDARRGVDAASLEAAFAALAPLGAAPVEALGAAYEPLVGLAFACVDAPAIVCEVEERGAHAGGARSAVVDLAALASAKPSSRVAQLEAALGVAAPRRVISALASGVGEAQIAHALAPIARGPIVAAGALAVVPTTSRRRRGSHYTPSEVADLVVARALDGLLDRAAPLELRVCDPAMGGGAFLFAAARRLALGAPIDRVIDACLHGVDRDAEAAWIARVGCWLLSGGRADERALEAHLVVGDALVDATVGARGSFDAVVGNPPWVAYAGRAAQPLEAGERARLAARYRAFAGYRTLHGVFVERGAELLRAGGRLGLLLPTSVADLDGYAPVRAAHDRLAEVDAELPDLGADVFDGVFQPTMALLSTRRPAPVDEGSRAAWPLARGDLDPVAARLLTRLAALPPLPSESFGERGIQTNRDDDGAFAARKATPHVVAVRVGRDVAAYRAGAPRLWLDPAAMGARLRTPEAWRAVAVLLRQTSRYPIAALADGRPFRNSLLAGFARGPLDAGLLLAWLNAAPIRWLHYTRFRDARQGMPQLKIGHLRATPAPPASAIEALSRAGAELGARNRGATPQELDAIDALVADALVLEAPERALVRAWAGANPPPEGR
ncbi:MAG TPA: N-6 DNA methylase [Byssovorax sp.]